MTTGQRLIMIAMVALGTLITRFLPFILFPDSRPTPKVIQYLGNVLPYCVIALLVVYCLKHVSVVTYAYGLPELIAIVCIVGVHVWKRSSLLSIAVGTVVYMLLVQLVFVG